MVAPALQQVHLPTITQVGETQSLTAAELQHNPREEILRAGEMVRSNPVQVAHGALVIQEPAAHRGAQATAAQHVLLRGAVAHVAPEAQTVAHPSVMVAEAVHSATAEDLPSVVAEEALAVQPAVVVAQVIRQVAAVVDVEDINR